MKRELTQAREAIQHNLIAFFDGMPQDCVDKTCEIVVSGFAPLFEELANRTRKSVGTVQILEKYRVIKTTNLLDLRIGAYLSKEEAAKLIADGVHFTVSVNK